jgi:tRNA A-37 threonylcarbamoyl transferase component Bud32
MELRDPGSFQVAGSSPAPAGPDILNMELLQRAVADSQHRVFPIEFSGRRYWVKRSRKNLPNIVGRLLHRLTQLVSRKDQDKLAMHEVRCLEKLRSAGFLTPDVVFRNAHYVVLSDIGPSLEAVLTLASPQERTAIVRKAGEALRALHDAGRWHGAARTHNMTLCGDRIGFIDLENTVENWMPPLMRQAWDLYQLGQSAAFFEPHAALAETAMRAYGPGRVRKLLYGVALLLFGPYVVLYPFRNGRKREIRQGHACVRAIYRAPRKSPADI